MRQKSLLASFLKQKRVAAGLSQSDVADKLGYSTPQFISNWERGVSHPPISALKKLGAMYSVSPEDLFELTLTNSIQEVTADLRRKFAQSTTAKQISFPGLGRVSQEHSINSRV